MQQKPRVLRQARVLRHMIHLRGARGLWNVDTEQLRAHGREGGRGHLS